MEKILFIGDLTEYGRCFQRYQTLIRLCYEVFGVSSAPSQNINNWKSNILERLLWKLSLSIDRANINNFLEYDNRLKNIDVFWIEKGNTLRPNTLLNLKKRFPQAKIISISEDDMYATHNHSLYYRLGLKYYDIVFTTKKYNLEELKKFGAKQTQLFLDAYDETLHRPLDLSLDDIEKYGADVSFIGTFEKNRAEKMIFLAKHGIQVTIRGNGWSKLIKKHRNLIVKDIPVYGEEYVKTINASKINLCFLRKINRDEVTSRSVEIPACGGFMLGERTSRHLWFFREGEEADFFDSDEEMLKKVIYYLHNSDIRKKIGQSGRKRCLTSGYSHKEQILEILAKTKVL